MSSAQNISCVLVGDAGVGKTSMLFLYTTCAFPGENMPKVFDNCSANVMVDGKLFNLALLDSTSQENSDQTRLSAYKQADVFLVCFAINRRDSFESVRTKWVPEIRYHCPDTPVLLIGCKCDLRDGNTTMPDGSIMEIGPDPVTQEQALACQAKLGAFKYIEVSSFRQRVKEPFTEAIRVVEERRTEGKRNSKKDCVVQ